MPASSPKKQPVFRFAPSPNGLLHLGHAYSALTCQTLCQTMQGRMLLRLEDIDTTRCRSAFEEAIYDDLTWLGLTWEQPVRRQSAHFAAYRDMIARLNADGLVYRCYATRKDIRIWHEKERDAGHNLNVDPDGAPLYPGRDRLLPTHESTARAENGAPFALRLDMARAIARRNKQFPDTPLRWQETGINAPAGGESLLADPQAWGDVVLARKETPTSYHVSVVLDDALQGITHIVRGEDLFHATSIHRLLQDLLGLPAPIYHHHALITDATGRKLAKSEGDTSLQSLRARGMTQDDIKALLADNLAN